VRRRSDKPQSWADRRAFQTGCLGKSARSISLPFASSLANQCLLMLRRGKYAVLYSTSSMSGEFCRRLRCRITFTFSQHQPAGMRSSAISQNGLNAGSTKRIVLRIADRLCQTAPPRIGDGRKVVLIAYCDLMNRSRKNGNTSAKIPCGLVSSSIQRTGHTSFNSTPNELGV
jgi:hypothetical protein